MNQITIRSIPKDIEKIIRDTSHRKGISMNKAVISLLEKAVGRGPHIQQKYTDLDRFCGIWSTEETAQFDKYIEEFEEIDEDLWR